MADSDEETSLFVYGTLIHPHILARVLSGSLRTPSSKDAAEHQQYSHLHARPAILKSHEIRRVRGQEYPGLIHQQDAEAPVRGIVVSGLTHAEIAHLDRFEGDEYLRVEVEATVPSSEEPVPNDVRSKWTQNKIQDILDEKLPVDRVQALLAGTEPADQIPVDAYLWVAPQGDLEPRDGPRGPWEFAAFSKTKSSRWTGGEWTDHGGPDGLEDRPQTPSTPIPQDRATTDGKGGFDEVRRTLEHGAGGSSSSFSTYSIPASDDPWADPPRTASARQTPSATEDRSDNPWAASSLTGGAATVDSTLEYSGASSHPASHHPIPEGYPLELEGQEVPGYERFGKPVRRWFLHGGGPSTDGSERRFISFNNGALGTCPKPVMDSYLSLSRKADEFPDAFERRHIREALPKLRARVAKMVNVPVRELVMIRNTTAGTNAVIRGYPWEKDDYVIHLSTLYGAVSNTIQYVSDTNGLASPKRVIVDITYPITHEHLVKKFTETLEKAKAEGKKVKMASIEVITSRPGVRLPWEQLVKVCRDHGVLSLVDGAHSFGHVPLDLGTVQPDFFVSTVHKWAYTHRAAAFLHVPVRNQSLVPSNPTSWGYRSAQDRRANPEKQASDDFLAQWSETGLTDYSPVLSLDAALDFREKLGGEHRIQAYNNSLALLGGLRLTQILKVSLLETSPQPTLSSHMINFPLPIVPRVIGGQSQSAVSAWLYEKGGEAYIWDTLHDEFHTAVTIWPFQSQVMVRVSAQIWLDLDDFEYLGRALAEVCRRINAGEADLKAA